MVTVICVAGIRWTSNLQWVLLGVEYAAVVVLSVWGIVKAAVSHPAGATPFHWAWLSPFSIGGVGALASGLVLGVFFFWGWDTATNLNEESRERTKTPGRAGVIAMFLLLFIFLLNIVAAQMLLPAKVWSSSNGTILFVFAQRAAGNWASYLMVAAVLSSTVATTQTTLLPAARIALSMAREGVLPHRLATIQGSRRTPVVATLVLATLGMVGIVLIPTVHSVSDLLNDLVSNIGVLVAYYYGITGLTCAWAYRKVAFVRLRFFLTGFLLPAVGGLALLAVGGVVIAQAGWSGARADIITLVLGVPLAFVARWGSTGDYFRRGRVAYADIGD